MAYDIDPFDGGEHQGARRLLALASHLDTIRDQDYDHQTWRRRRPDGSWSMCALGHAVTALPDAIGLRWRDSCSADIVRLDGSGVTQDTLTLAAESFELSLDEAATLFGIGLYTAAFYRVPGVPALKPKAVAAAIREFAWAKIAGVPRRVMAA